ncbi:hypothetical protein RJZ56_000786 [Blastomyces dermatitidis]|uniref:Uncharacterized protein n=3 Tax=Blastomyces TaxID=229219 RepID=A0A179UUZ0_BLAGS|nr:uncharacterized protein BDBG_07051 [Blastomyces gilchristii SLH14081]XP_045278517.1 uncharacterized protein BDCG_07237 [Blastomyces dermatitidis ER-3]EGE78606.1 hypothetical protein BDDG_01543 [Blastomyces dermatitidis ATCC 18188]EQL35427.1 hypothetical protein BDFG_02914 [Blastomyces dermatitidis ATCC 26199]EEQ92117.1 hypothetical protein BDCG_07237 [Blastomyces dermatitidis ER-3]OAT11603.1 hypothetical protein BDBG_07051 [Blastomyces gilchristii SLH14081]
MSAAYLRTQILANAKFLYGPEKKFEIITGLVFLGMYGNIQASNAILVTTDADAGTFRTHLVGTPKEHIDDAMMELHNEVTKKIYEKLSVGLDENAAIEAGETVIEGTLDW